jgi:hypothetical protein
MSRQDGLIDSAETRAASGDGELPTHRSGFGRRGARDERISPGSIRFEVLWLNECGAMLRYASTRGMEIPAKAAYTVRELDNKRSKHGDHGWIPIPRDAADLVAAHSSLSRLVEPATPRSITLVNEQSPRSPWLALLGGVLVVRLMMFMAIAFLVAFLLVLPIAGDDPADAIATGSWGEGVLGAVYIVLAAGLGVLFSQLFRINRQISRGQYDPTEDAAHVTTIVLGLIAGVILAMLLPDVLKPSDATENFSPALLALLGGFSAPVVYGVVARLVDAVGTLVGGDPRDQTAAEVQEAITRAKLASEQDRRRIAGRAFRVGDEATRVLQITDPQEQARAIQQLRDEITDMLNDLVPEVGTDSSRRLDEPGRRSPPGKPPITPPQEP